MIDHYNQQDFDLITYCDHFLVVKAQKFAQWRKFICEMCNGLELNGQLEWDKHLQTRKHRNKKRSIAKGALNNKEYYINKKREEEELKAAQADTQSQADE